MSHVDGLERPALVTFIFNSPINDLGFDSSNRSASELSSLTVDLEPVTENVLSNVGARSIVEKLRQCETLPASQPSGQSFDQ